MAYSHILRQQSLRMIRPPPSSRCFASDASPSSKAMPYVTSKTNYTTYAPLTFAFQQRQDAFCAVIFGSKFSTKMMTQTCLFTAILLGEVAILLGTYASPGRATTRLQDASTGSP
jgi:hypothetical protein